MNFKEGKVFIFSGKNLSILPSTKYFQKQIGSCLHYLKFTGKQVARSLFPSSANPRTTKISNSMREKIFCVWMSQEFAFRGLVSNKCLAFEPLVHEAVGPGEGFLRGSPGAQLRRRYREDAAGGVPIYLGIQRLLLDLTKKVA